jgi:hypothetical protein
MFHTVWHSKSAWLSCGLVVGLVVGGWWPHAPAHAVAGDRHDNFAICTGAVEQGLEALFVLDFLTGQISAGVLSPQNGKFTALYSHNINKDLQVDPTQGPRYLMCTGAAQIQARGAGMQRGSASVLYVAELSTGRIAAYTLPWAGNTAAGGVVGAPFLLLDVRQFRANVVRPAGAVGAPK